MMRTSKVSQGRLRVELLEDRVQPGSLLKDSMGWSVVGDLLATRRQAAANIALIQADAQQEQEALRQMARLSFVAGAAPATVQTPVANATPVAVQQDQGAMLQKMANFSQSGGTAQFGGSRELQVRQVPSMAMDASMVEAELAPAPITLQPVIHTNTLNQGGGVATIGLNWSSYLGLAGNDGSAAVELVAGSTLISTGHLTNPDTGETLASITVADEATFTGVGVLTFGFDGATDTRINGQVASADGSMLWITGTSNVPTASGGTLAFAAGIDLLTPAIMWAVGYDSAADGTPVEDGCSWVAGDPASLNACGNGIALSADGTEVALTGSLVRTGGSPGRAMLVARLDALGGTQNNGFTFRFARGGAAGGDSEGRAIEVNSINETIVAGYFFDNFDPTDNNQLLGGRMNPDSSFAGGLLFINPGSDKGLGLALNAFQEPHVVGYFANEDDPTVNDLAFARFAPDLGSGEGFGLAVDGGTIDGRGIGINEAGEALITGGVADAALTDMDAYVLRLSAEPAVLDFSGLATDEFPALGMDAGRGLAVGPGNAVYITGNTTSSDFLITPGVIQELFGGDVDMFMTKLTVGDF